MSAVTIRIPDPLTKELDQASRQTKLNRSQILREALEAWLKKRRKEEFIEELKRAAEHDKGLPWDQEEDDLWTIASNEALDIAEGISTGEPSLKPFRPRKRRQR